MPKALRTASKKETDKYFVVVPAKHFKAYVKKSKSGCWLWTGQKTKTGYGKFYVTMGAHRVAYQLFRGPIPENLVIDHLCRNTSCVNPAHLEAVTTRENLARGNGFVAKNIKKTHCPKGHPYNEANTYKRKGRRVCRRCEQVRTLRYYHEVYKVIRTERRRQKRAVRTNTR